MPKESTKNDTASAKRAREKSEFENFLRLGGESFDSFESAEPPEPDIVANRGKDTFGVEITDFCEQAIKQRESEAHGVVKLAGKVYSESGEPFLDVGVMWAPHFKITKPRSEKLAKNLAAVVRMKTPELGMRRTLDWRDFDPELVEAIAHVSIDHTIASTQHSWNCVGGGPIPPWNIEELQARIDAKNNKPAKYPVHYREKWLLIVSAFGAPFGWRKMTPEIEAHAFRSAFDRIVLLSSFPSEVFNLLVNRVCAQPFPAAIPSQSSRTAAR